MNQDNLREKVKLCKIYHDTSYKWFAEYLGITRNSMYNWLHKQYDFSEYKANELDDIVTDLLT